MQKSNFGRVVAVGMWVRISSISTRVVHGSAMPSVILVLYQTFGNLGHAILRKKIHIFLIAFVKLKNVSMTGF
jgi:hypothetical protein